MSAQTQTVRRLSVVDIAKMHAEGVRIAQEMLLTAKPMVQGVQVSAPFGRYSSAADVLSVVLDASKGSKQSPGHPTSEERTLA